MNNRLPSIPLITCDPYFSIWQPANELNSANTCHWTGAEMPMRAIVTIDGEKLSLIGKNDAVKPIKQDSYEITATMTKYCFSHDDTKLEVAFCTPLLLDDLMLCSRPVSYISFKASSENTHEISVNLSFDESYCYDKVKKPMLGRTHKNAGIGLAWMGQKKQIPLGHSGDNTTIDWGYLYLASKTGEVSYNEANSVSTLNADFRLDVKAINETVIAVGYDDISAIQYFDDVCNGYWKKYGDNIVKAMNKAVNEYEDIKQRCAEFDVKMADEAVNIGGENYKQICIGGYRQAIAAHKIAADKNGNVLFISKECFSNGCAATVDVSYPSTPLFLLYNPELVRGMLRPIFKFSKSDVWEFDFAPHDAGRYPYVWGQVYALSEYPFGDGDVMPPYFEYNKGENIYDFKHQMPVEECGNMLIMTAAVTLADSTHEGINFVRDEIDTLKKWVNYLIEYGSDPGDQLCTDDFGGHLAHNVNLSAKAILGVEAYSIILKFLGDSEWQRYHEKAKEMAADWEQRAAFEDHTVLAYGDTSGWSLKYNLVWDIVFDSELFSKSTYSREVEWYKKMANEYGIPLDSRKDYTKSDWILWVVTFADNKEDFEALTKGVASFLENAPDRVPFSDWFDTKTAKVVGFQNRTVQGGLFMPILKHKGLTEK